MLGHDNWTITFLLLVLSVGQSQHLEVFDIQGKVVMRQELTPKASQRVVLDLPSGIYVAGVSGKSGKVFVKVFVP